VIHPLSTLPGDIDGNANAINDTGQAVGVSVGSCSGSPAHAVLWEHGAATGLGSLGGTAFDGAISINLHAQVVGFSSLPGDTDFHAFYWSRQSGMQDLGTLPWDSYSIAVRINAAGQAVGFSCDASVNCRAVLWHDRAITNLNTLTAAGSSLFLLDAFGINACGEIVGQALQTSTGEQHAFLARPDNGASTSGAADLVGPRVAAKSRRLARPQSLRNLFWPRSPLRRLGHQTTWTF
jgi:probable HAF family extracellular repeat protein